MYLRANYVCKGGGYDSFNRDGAMIHFEGPSSMQLDLLILPGADRRWNRRVLRSGLMEKHELR